MKSIEKIRKFSIFERKASNGITMVIPENAVFGLVGDSYDLYKYLAFIFQNKQLYLLSLRSSFKLKNRKELLPNGALGTNVILKSVS
ncbi:hypothetical protein ABH966_001294 [Lysinibacillus sp. RC46]|uniref:hypothetical protein n=1 Tax=unclassified Lysinibacillus TaxID=2636778 RepID=UPI00351278B6